MATIHAYWDPVFQSVHLVSSLWWVVTLSRASGLGLCWKQAVKMVRCFSVRTVRPRWDRPLPLPWPRERPPLLQAILSQMLIFSGLYMSQSLELYFFIFILVYCLQQWELDKGWPINLIGRGKNAGLLNLDLLSERRDGFVMKLPKVWVRFVRPTAVLPPTLAPVLQRWEAWHKYQVYWEDEGKKDG